MNQWNLNGNAYFRNEKSSVLFPFEISYCKGEGNAVLILISDEEEKMRSTVA